jgi:hypothetical protein
MKKHAIGLALAAMLLTACATAFTGSAHVEGGPAECAQRCGAWGMELAGMVAMGEYSDACICQVKGKTVSKNDVAGVTGGAVAVVMQQRRGQTTPQN